MLTVAYSDDSSHSFRYLFIYPKGPDRTLHTTQLLASGLKISGGDFLYDQTASGGGGGGGSGSADTGSEYLGGANAASSSKTKPKGSRGKKKKKRR